MGELRAWRKQTEWPGAEDHVFPSRNGTALNPSTVHSRVLKPAAQEAGVPWAGFYAFRHTCASLLFAQGRNIKQVQHWLGHSDPSFTLRTYVHLLPGDQPAPLDLDAELTTRHDHQEAAGVGMSDNTATIRPRSAPLRNGTR